MPGSRVCDANGCHGDNDHYDCAYDYDYQADYDHHDDYYDHLHDYDKHHHHNDDHACTHDNDNNDGWAFSLLRSVYLRGDATGNI